MKEKIINLLDLMILFKMKEIEEDMTRDYSSTENEHAMICKRAKLIDVKIQKELKKFFSSNRS